VVSEVPMKEHKGSTVRNVLLDTRYITSMEILGTMIEATSNSTAEETT